MLLSELLNGLTIEKIYQSTQETTIREVYADSRLIQKGDLFVALSGGSEDGHEYVADAEKRGAVAAVVEKYQKDVRIMQNVVKDTRKALSFIAANRFSNPQDDLKIVGVTGTNGKTTTCHLLASILRAAGKRVGVIGTIGCFYEGREYPSALTTPDPLTLFRVLSDMRRSGVEYVVTEVSAHAIYYKKTAAIPFSACIFTNCTQDHLDFFGTMERYAAVKKSLFEGERGGVAIVNADDPLGAEILRGRADAKSYALKNSSSVTAEIKEAKTSGTKIRLCTDEGVVDTKLRLTGEYNVYNALAAACCARALGVDNKAIAQGLSALERVPGRLERVGSVHGGDIFVDFAHTPDGLEKVLSAIKERCRGRLCCVFGCGGNRDAKKRPLMGEVAARYADFSVLTSDNPRYEEPYSIISAIEKGYRKYSRDYVVEQDRRKAIEYAARRLGEGDALVVAGKGAENYQEIMGIKYDYNDKTVIEEIVAKILSEE